MRNGQHEPGQASAPVESAAGRFGAGIEKCDGCDQQNACSSYNVTFHSGARETVRYCDDCAALARVNWNGETASITPVATSVAFQLIGSPVGHTRSRYHFAAGTEPGSITCECGRSCADRAEMVRHHNLERMLTGGAP